MRPLTAAARRGAVVRFPLAAALAVAARAALALMAAEPGVHAAPPEAQAAAREAAAVEELLRSARLWQSLGRVDAERAVLVKLLAVDPEEPRALFRIGELELRAGRPEEARRALQLLQAGASGAAPAALAAQRRALLAELQTMEMIYTRDKDRLSELRLVMRGGNRARAQALARSLFPDGRPPGDLANEFAGLLSASPGGWQTLRRHLEQRIASNPSSADRLSLYELLARQPQTRAEALRGFAELSRASDIDPSVVAQAWRAALEPLRGDEEGLRERRRYLGRFPRDVAVRADAERIERAQAREQQAAREEEEASRDPAVLERRAAERALAEGQLDQARQHLAASLALRPDDPETVGTQGLLQLREARYAEASASFERALQAEKSRPGLAARWRDLAATARYWGAIQHARQLRDSGRLDEALQEVEEVRDTQPGQREALYLIAALQAERGQEGQAQQLYGELLQADRGDARAWRGWLSLELRQGKIESALDTAQDLLRAYGVAPEEALDAGDLRDAVARGPGVAGARHPDATLRLLERGVALLPGEAWLRYDLARAYLDLGLPELARQVMQEGQETAPQSATMRYAAALVDAALDDEDAALGRLEAIAPADQTDGMRALASRMRFERALRMAAAARAAGREQEDAAWRAQALREAGDDVGRRLRVARADLSADDTVAARALLDPMVVNDGGWDLDDRRTAASLQIDEGHPQSALASIDRLAAEAAARGSVEDQAQALLLRAKAHEALGDTQAARADFAQLQAALPADEVVHRVEAIELMDRDRDTAHAWMDELLARHPQDPRVLLEAGLQARRDGRYDEAMRQLAEADALAPPPGAPGAGAFERRAQEARDDIEARRQPRIETGWLWLSRSAEDGMSSYHGREIPVVVSWPGGYDGHWFVQVDSVKADAGTLAAPLATSGLFGEVLALPPTPTGLAAPIDEQAQGYSMAAGWRSDNRRVDLGLVGAGFKSPSVVGGWRESRTWNGTDVSAELTRRVLTASVLSYAGAADPSTGTVWGGTTDTALSARAERDLPGRWSLSGSLSAGVVTGRNVASNPNQEARVFLDRDWIARHDFRLSAGPSLSLWRYDSNEGFYTFGQGGYYSPQRYIALGVPVEIEGRHGLWSYDLRLVPSRSWTSSQGAPYYPTDGALQRLAGDPTYAGGPGGGPSLSGRADVEVRAAPHWTLGAWLDIDRSAYYQPTRVMLYLRYWFKAQQGEVPYPPRPVVPISLY